MKNIYQFLVLIFLTLLSCSERQKVEKVENSAEIKIVKLNQGKGIIFPAIYSKKIFTNSYKVKGVFTPDEKTVRYIDENLADNYETILTKFQTENPSFSVLKKDLKFYDKQFFGYINPKKDSIITCIIFNLKDSNPYNNLKQRIEKEYAYGSGFWFDSNVLEFKFDIKTKEFISCYE